MSAHRRILLVGLPFVLALLVATPGRAVLLTLRIVNANNGAPAAARLQLVYEDQPIFGEEDLTLRSHLDNLGHPFFYAEDRVELELDPGEYRIRCYAGPTSVPRETVVQLTNDLEQLIEVEHWIDPRNWGWYCADPHVHLQHGPDSTGATDYLTSTTVDAGRAGRAEGLDVLYLLQNSFETPSGLVSPNEPGISVCWGEEFRSGYWGHMVVLNQPNLVTVAGNPWANGPGLPAWPLLRKVLQDNSPPLAYMAHPETGSSNPYATSWPSTGYARELPSLVDVDELHGIAVGSGSNGPYSAWHIEVLMEGLAGGADWAVFGETDAVLSRLHTRPVGSPRTYARLTKSPTPGSEAMEDEWRGSARDGHSYASDGPLLLEFVLGGASMGEATTLLDEIAGLELHLISWTPLRRVTLWGSSGRGVEVPVAPEAIHDLQIQLDVEFETDELVFLEAVAEGGTWYAQEDSLRLVSSPIRVLRGLATPVPGEMARRKADGLAQLWMDCLHYRGFESDEDSAATRVILEDSEAAWENFYDDAPGEFSPIWPPDGRELGSAGLQLNWSRARSYDGEQVLYEVHLDSDPDFANAEIFAALPDTFLFLQDALEETQHWWRVRAYEPDGDSRWMQPDTLTFTVLPGAVGAPSPTGTLLRLSPPQTVAGGVRARLELSRDARVRWSWFDARGRLLYRSGRESMAAGRHELHWSGRDRQGRGVASGVYWLVADAEGRQSVRSAVLIEP